MKVRLLQAEKYSKAIQTKDAVLICSPKPTPEFPDNLQGTCAECGCDIYYRPYNVKATKKICENCGFKVIEKRKHLGRISVHGSVQIIDDLKKMEG